MTVKEYNTILHPKISCAEVFINGIEHATQKTDIQTRHGNNLPVSDGLMNVKKQF